MATETIKNVSPIEAALTETDSPTLISVNATSTQVNVARWRGGVLTDATDKVAEEVPIALIYNGISHVVMLATPADLTDFALGFSLSEGIFRDKSDLYDVDIVPQAQGIELQMDVATECFVQLKQRRRNLTGRTGCGLCGAESLDQALRLPAQSISLTASKLPVKSIELAFKMMQSHQPLQQVTGATHACVWVSAQGEIQLVREDVGRHNAMDKLIGALAKSPMQADGFVLTSSRASVEMVQKVATAGISILAAISAPTGLAIRVAETYGVTLIGFLRDNQFVIYTHKHRIQF
ncbi:MULTISPECIES: formate dehydrogenase accessory sulfurtransferase FdhD [Methylotenera]|uniref:formate dehydrogenase accessory sulfurtransferase FdhD n=1 Tax=Methylotenera TaxID=359407 RepID=UPI000360C3CA|nr:MULTISPECIES: formate dehydrogenase accessory sulfurtransferase FdhD [Methylotenera]